MVLSYVPLFFATSTYTRLGLEQLQRENAIKLGRSVAGHLSVLRQQTEKENFLHLARAQIESDSVHALSILDPSGNPEALFGELELFKSISAESGFAHQEEIRRISTPIGGAVLVFEPSPEGGIAAIVRVDKEVTRADSLARMMALYMVMGALALLATAYFALTRWIVRPILELERGANRVAAGGHRLEPLKGVPRELANLSSRLGQMTGLLREEEETLRAKVDELELLTAELREAQASLVRSERLATVGRLAAGLAHEVGNPISALMGLQDLVIDGGLSQEEHDDFLHRMRKETKRIDRVLSDLLAYARPAGQTSASPRGDPGSLKSAIAGTLALLAPQGDMLDMKFDSEIEDELPAVPLSEEELTQILLNLIMNAADACEHKGNIWLKAHQISQEKITLSIEDDGPGISDEVMDSLFEPFVSTKDVGKGTGLGLAVTKGLIEGASGTIRVERGEQGGARFVIQLPLNTASVDLTPALKDER